MSLGMICERKESIFLRLFLIAVMLCSLVGCNSDASEPSSGYTELPMDMETLEALQAEVDQGHQPGYLDPQQVSREFLNQSLQIDTAGNVELYQSKENMRIYRVSIEGQPDIEVYLEQPVRKGSSGIWTVKKYRRLD